MLKKIFTVILVVGAVFLSAASVQAHYLWLNVSTYTPQVGDPVQIEIGWGHKFPTDEVIKPKFLNKVFALGPTGKEISLKKLSTARYELVPDKNGVYLILADVHPGFVTKTPEGYKMQNKKGLPQAQFCFRYDMAAKAVINVGKPQQGLAPPTSKSLEIIPLKTTRKLTAGEIFPIMVRFQGKPLAGAEVKATYAGFSDQSNAFAVTTKTDNHGVANIKLGKPGKWLVVTCHKTPYPVPEDCDDNLYKYTLTFDVK